MVGEPGGSASVGVMERSGVATGWMIAVMVELTGEATPLRHFYAVAQADRARAEWAAVDSAMTIGVVAMSPVRGMEPVDAVGPLSARAISALGLGPGQVRAFGQKQPRRWLATVA
ncbi:MAG: hypothetical protein ABIO39_10560 [Caulobacteraceae bacterium]